MKIRVACLALGVLAGCGGDEAAQEVAAEVTQEVVPEVADEVEVDAEVADEVEAEVADEVAEVAEVADEVVQALAMPGLAEAIVFTPEAEALGVRVQPTLAWDGATNGYGRLAMGWTGHAGDDLGIVLGVWDVDGRGAHEVHAPIVVNEDRNGVRNEPSMCTLADGGFVVVWSVDTQQGPDNLQVAWRRFGRDGVPVDAREVVVATSRTGNHWLGEVACTDEGGFVIAGVRSAAEGPGFAAFTKHYDRSGQPGAEADVFARATGSQLFPVVAMAGAATWVAWEDTPTLEADTVIALRADGERYEVVVAPGSDAQAPFIAGRDGALLVGGSGDGRLRVALGDGVAAPTPLPLPDSGAMGAAAVAVRGDGFAMVWFRGAGANVEVRYAPIDKATFGAVVTLERGSFPLAYRPAIAMTPGFGAVAWTASLGSGKFSVNVALFAP